MGLPQIAPDPTLPGEPPGGPWQVYLVRTRSGSLYTGIATDVERRLAAHRGEIAGGAKYLRARGPLAVVYRVRVGSRALALRVEHRLKRLTKAHKERIVALQPAGPRLLALLALEAPGGEPGPGQARGDGPA